LDGPQILCYFYATVQVDITDARAANQAHGADITGSVRRKSSAVSPGVRQQASNLREMRIYLPVQVSQAYMRSLTAQAVRSTVDAQQR
jgi:hypothetical protein